MQNLSNFDRAALEQARKIIDSVLLESEQRKHLPGGHDQATHAHGGSISARQGMGDIPITAGAAADFRNGSAAPHLVDNGDGTFSFTPERQAMHDKIVSEALDGVPESSDPTLHLLGGGPASGKSTMLSSSELSVPKGRSAAQINADDVKEQLPEYRAMVAIKNPAAANFAHEESSYLAKRIQAGAIERRQDIVLDGTGDSSESSLRGKITAARGNGYKVVGNYATVPTDLAVSRALARGEKTGRVVPETVIRGVHRSVSEVFDKASGEFDIVNLWDTTGAPRLLATGRKGSKLSIRDQAGYDSFLAKASE